MDKYTENPFQYSFQCEKWTMLGWCIVLKRLAGIGPGTMAAKQPGTLYSVATHHFARMARGVLLWMCSLGAAQCFSSLLLCVCNYICRCLLLLQGGRLHTTEHPVPTVWGATNPFFLRTRIPDLSIVVVTSSPASNSAMGTSGSLKRSTSQSNTTLLPTVLATARAFSALLSSSVDALPADFLDGTRGGICLSQPSLCGGPDKATLAKLDSIQRTDHNRSSPRQTTTTSNVLRAHFYALTCAFLAPFCKFCGISPPWDAGAQVCFGAPALCALVAVCLPIDQQGPSINLPDFILGKKHCNHAV
jgi:hypothetical protein